MTINRIAEQTLRLAAKQELLNQMNPALRRLDRGFRQGEAAGGRTAPSAGIAADARLARPEGADLASAAAGQRPAAEIKLGPEAGRRVYLLA